jgi:hypothetical protein
VDAKRKPTTTLVELSPSAATIPSQPIASATFPLPERSLKPPKRRHKPLLKDTEQSAGNNQPAATETSAVSAIGKLSSGDPPDLFRETVDSIASIEHGLNSISRALSDEDQKTAAQIREFLKQAREALASSDVDGARTLAAKAKVLLSELNP